VREVTVAAIQMELKDAFTKSDVEENVAHALEMVERAASRGAEIIGLPEFFNAGSWLENRMPEAVVEPLDGPTYQRVVEKAVKLGVWLVAGTIPAKRNGKVFNAGLIVSPTGETTYFSRGWFYYGFYELEGKYPVVESEFGRIGCIICGDIILTEVPRMYRYRNAEIVFHPTLANDVIFSPFGERLAEAPEDREHILVAKLDPSVRAKTWFGGRNLDEAKEFFEGPLKETIRRINFSDALASALKSDREST